MARNSIKKGTTLTIHANGRSYVSGVPALVGESVCVPATHIADGEEGEAHFEQVWRLPKDPAVEIAPFTNLNFDAVANQFTTAALAEGGGLIGGAQSTEHSPAGESTVAVKLLQGTGQLA